VGGCIALVPDSAALSVSICCFMVAYGEGRVCRTEVISPQARRSVCEGVCYFSSNLTYLYSMFTDNFIYISHSRSQWSNHF